MRLWQNKVNNPSYLILSGALRMKFFYVPNIRETKGAYYCGQRQSVLSAITHFGSCFAQERFSSRLL